MLDAYLGNLLNNVLNGDESSFMAFRRDRITSDLPEECCDMYQMLLYVVEQAKQRQDGLWQCYPEALIELARFVSEIALGSDKNIKDCMLNLYYF